MIRQRQLFRKTTHQKPSVATGLNPYSSGLKWAAVPGRPGHPRSARHRAHACTHACTYTGHLSHACVPAHHMLSSPVHVQTCQPALTRTWVWGHTHTYPWTSLQPSARALGFLSTRTAVPSCVLCHTPVPSDVVLKFPHIVVQPPRCAPAGTHARCAHAVCADIHTRVHFSLAGLGGGLQCATGSGAGSGAVGKPRLSWCSGPFPPVPPADPNLHLRGAPAATGPRTP